MTQDWVQGGGPAHQGTAGCVWQLPEKTWQGVHLSPQLNPVQAQLAGAYGALYSPPQPRLPM